MRVAVVGGGISGMAAAYAAQDIADVTLFEAAGSLGGHTDTHNLFVDGRAWAVDSGFIVFNRTNYPLFSGWLEDLGVASKPSQMSFGVTTADGLEYGTTGFDALFCQRRNLVRPDFLGMLRDIRRFYREAPALGAGDRRSVADFLAGNGYSRRFADGHLLPMCAAIWSLSRELARDVPMVHVGRFMANHGLLRLAERPRWRVVAGGSNAYVRAFESRFRGAVEVSAPVATVERDPAGVTVRTAAGGRRFDGVVLACHADDAMALIEPTPLEREIAGAFEYRSNRAVVHSDPSVMPRNRGAWSSWNVRAAADGSFEFTYWMNRLQGIESATPFFVTLNPRRELARVWAEREYRHPVFTLATMDAQRRRHELRGRSRTAWAGAWLGWGFHEDGYRSGVEAAAGIAAACRSAGRAAPC